MSLPARAAASVAVATLLALASRVGGVAALAAARESAGAETGAEGPSVPLTATIWRPEAEAGTEVEGVDALKGGFHLAHGGSGHKAPLRRNLQCSCSAPGSCGCCAPIEVPQVGFSQTVCLNLTFQPEDLTVRVNVILNGNSILDTTLSGNSPPPLCIPVPQFPPLALCVRLYDLGLSPGGLRACVNLEVQLQGVPLLVARFDCVRVGPGGVSVEPRPPAVAAATAAAADPADDNFHDDVQGLSVVDDAAKARGRWRRRLIHMGT